MFFWIEVEPKEKTKKEKRNRLQALGMLLKHTFIEHMEDDAYVLCDVYMMNVYKKIESLRELILCF